MCVICPFCTLWVFTRLHFECYSLSIKLIKCNCHTPTHRIKCCTVLSVCCVQIESFPLVRGGARVKPSSLQLILPFSQLNAVTLKGQGTGLSLMHCHSYSNCAASTSGGLKTLPHPLFLQIPWWSAPTGPLGPLGEGFLFPHGLNFQFPSFFF